MNHSKIYRKSAIQILINSGGGGGEDYHNTTSTTITTYKKLKILILHQKFYISTVRINEDSDYIYCIYILQSTPVNRTTFVQSKVVRLSGVSD